MNKRDSLDFEQMILAYYGELSEADHRRFRERLHHDREFAREYENVCQMLDQYSEHTIKTPARADNEEFWIALEYNINRRIRQYDSKQTEPKRLWHHIREYFISPLHIGVAFAGIGVAFFMGAIVGFGIKSRHTPITQTTVQTSPAYINTSTASSTVGNIANEHIRNFLKRSQLYIATTADRHLECMRCIPIEKQVDHRQFARELLKEAHRLRTLAYDNPKMQKVIQDVEVVLTGMVNSQNFLTPSQMEVLHNIASNAVCEVAATIDNTENNTVTSQP